jgi:hypothetical protein
MTAAGPKPKTVVLQSYRTERVEPVVEMGLATVRQWAASRGYDYVFMDDDFFGIVPAAFRTKTGGAIWQMADMARLLHIRRLLDSFERAVWIDADVVVLNVAAMELPTSGDFFFCREFWVADLAAGPLSRLRIQLRVNNSVCGFTRGAEFLDWYIAETERVTLAAPPDTNWNTLPVSTKILTAAWTQLNFTLFEHCAIFSPGLHTALSDPAIGSRVWHGYARHIKGVFAINMTMSLQRSGQLSAAEMSVDLARLWSINSGPAAGQTLSATFAQSAAEEN